MEVLAFLGGTSTYLLLQILGRKTAVANIWVFTHWKVNWKKIMEKKNQMMQRWKSMVLVGAVGRYWRLSIPVFC